MLAAEFHFFQAGQLAQAGVEDGVGLDVRQGEGLDQTGLGLLLIADDADHLVQVEVGDHQAVEDVQTRLDLAQPVAGAADQHVAAVIEEGSQGLLQVHDARRAARIKDVEVDAEACLQIGELEQALHQHLGLDVAALGFEDQAHVLGALVTHVAQQRGLLGVDELGEAFHQVGLLHLIGHLGDDDLVHALAQILLLPLRPNADAAPAGGIGFQHRGAGLDDHPSGGEVRPLDVGHQRLDRGVRLVE